MIQWLLTILTPLQDFWSKNRCISRAYTVQSSGKINLFYDELGADFSLTSESLQMCEVVKVPFVEKFQIFWRKNHFKFKKV